MPIDEGVYYLQNAQTQYYVIENSPNPTEGVIVTQDEYNDSDYQQWELAYTSTTSLYVTLRSTLNGIAKPFCDSCNEAMNGYTSNIIILGN